MLGSAGYRVRLRVQGHLDPAWWSGLFRGLALTVEPEGTSLLSGVLADQAAVHGLLATIRDLGLTLVSIETAANPGQQGKVVRDGDPAGGAGTRPGPGAGEGAGVAARADR